LARAAATRIDLHVDVPAVSPADLSLPPPRENSADIAARVACVRVARVRAVQRARYAKLGGETPPRSNAEADGDLLEKVAAPDPPGRQLPTQAAERLKLSARGYHRVLRVGRNPGRHGRQRRCEARAHPKRSPIGESRWRADNRWRVSASVSPCRAILRLRARRRRGGRSAQEDDVGKRASSPHIVTLNEAARFRGEVVGSVSSMKRVPAQATGA